MLTLHYRSLRLYYALCVSLSAHHIATLSGGTFVASLPCRFVRNIVIIYSYPTKAEHVNKICKWFICSKTNCSKWQMYSFSFSRILKWMCTKGEFFCRYRYLFKQEFCVYVILWCARHRGATRIDIPKIGLSACGINVNKFAHVFVWFKNCLFNQKNIFTCDYRLISMLN